MAMAFHDGYVRTLAAMACYHALGRRLAAMACYGAHDTQMIHTFTHMVWNALMHKQT